MVMGFGSRNLWFNKFTDNEKKITLQQNHYTFASGTLAGCLEQVFRNYDEKM